MTIGTEQHEIFDLRVTALLRTVNDVIKSRLAFGRNFQAHGERLTRRWRKLPVVDAAMASLQPGDVALPEFLKPSRRGDGAVLEVKDVS